MEISDDLPRKAEKLRELHRRGRPLVLVNAWDAATARIVEKAGSANLVNCRHEARAGQIRCFD